MLNGIFYKFQMVTDASLFDVAKAFPGWSPRVIGQGGFEQDSVMIDFGIFHTRKNVPNKRELLDIVAENPMICFMHNRMGTTILKNECLIGARP